MFRPNLIMQILKVSNENKECKRSFKKKMSGKFC